MLLLVLIIGWKNTSRLIAFHSPKKFNYEKEEGSLRVVTWNVARFVEIFKNNNKGSQTRLKMMDLLRQQDADILCLQEFHTSERANFYDNISYIQKNLNYPYFQFSYDEDGDKLFYSSIIFSRFPIINKSVAFYPKPTIPEALLSADIKFGDDTVTIFTTHLQSVQFARSDYKKINEIKNYEDSIMTNSKTIFSKLKRGMSYRAIQANMMRQKLDSAKHPLIVCGDFNDVPNSYTYNKVRGDLNDVFLEKGFGIGRTFLSLSPTLRIDYILTDKRFEIKQINRPVKNYSDHYMLVADLKLNPNP